MQDCCGDGQSQQQTAQAIFERVFQLVFVGDLWHGLIVVIVAGALLTHFRR